MANIFLQQRLFQRKDLVRYFFVRQSIDILTQTQIHKVIDNIRHLKKSLRKNFSPYAQNIRFFSLIIRTGYRNCIGVDLCSQNYIHWKKINPLCPMMREVSLETFSNVNIRDPSHDKNLPIILSWLTI